jgi:hypothetical protein
MRTTFRLLACTMIVGCLPVLCAGARLDNPLTLAVVLSRAGLYVERYLAAMEGLVAEERYVQDLSPMRPRVASFNGWLHPTTGVVTRSELVATPAGVRATFTTTFRNEDRFGVAVPVEMRELVIEGVQDGARRLEAVARYSDYRMYSVTTNERTK